MSENFATSDAYPKKVKIAFLGIFIWAIVATVVCIGLIIGLAVKSKKYNDLNTRYKYYWTNVSSENQLSYKGPINDTIDGAAVYNHSVEVLPSPYYASFDFYNEKPTKTLMILEHFKTYQQTSSYSCGPACAVMALNYIGITATETELSEKMDCGYPWHHNKWDKVGTATVDLAEAMRSYGVLHDFHAQGQPPWGDDYYAWVDFIKESIKNQMPIFVKSVDFGGHWTLIIGYDDLGTPDMYEDDVLIIADPFDTSDHRQDGYVVWSLDRYWEMWGVKFVNPKVAANEEYYYNFVRIEKKK